MPRDLFEELMKAEAKNREMVKLLEAIKPTELRDQFAGAALTGFMSLLSNNNVLAQMKGIEDQDKHLADRSYAIADAMLKARGES